MEIFSFFAISAVVLPSPSSRSTSVSHWLSFALAFIWFTTKLPLFEERGQKFVRFDDESPSIAAVRVNDVTPPVSRHGAAVAPCSTGRSDLVSDDLPVFLISVDSRVQYMGEI